MNPAGALLLQSWRLVGRVAELGSLGRMTPLAMSRHEFQSRVQSFRRAVRPLVVVYLLFALTGPFFTWPLLLNPTFHWFGRIFGSRDFAFWLTIMVLMLALVVPAYLISRVRQRFGLFCPKCHYPDRYGRFMRGVLRDGHCPHCKMEVLDAA